MTKCSKNIFRHRQLGLSVCLCISFFVSELYGQHLPTPQQRAAIDNDNARHFGDDPDNAGPLATHLSAKLRTQDVEAAMRKVADWELNRAQPYFGDIWTWSVLYTGFIAASEATGDAKYNDAMLAMANQFHWKLRSELPSADDQSLGQTYMELYFQKKDPVRIADTQAKLDGLIAAESKPAARIPWWWCDALFMAPPVWVRMYAATHDKKYLDYMNREWWKTSDLLYDNKEHLYFRDASYLSKTEPNGQKMFWSRGNGWVMAGIVRVLQYLPANDPMRARYIEQFKEMATRVASIQGEDGLWRSGLLDPDYYVLPENSGSALFTYAFAYGVNQGILPRKQYQPVVERAWKGLLSHIYADGRLGCLQQTGAAPAFYKPTASYNYGIGGFLLAGAEIDRMAKERHSSYK